MTLTLKTSELDATSENALRLPVGLASPLWLMIGSAAMVGAAMFWATRWMRPTNLEAVLPEPKVLPKPEPEVVAAAEKAVLEPVELGAETVEAVADAAVEVVEAVAEPVEAAVETVIEAPVAVAKAADDLTVMTGIGPKMAAMLADKGITRFEQIAAWTEADITTLDKELKLMGRVAREAWVAQAKRLVQG
jgi:predicted flap endonuclease-1-like 5' DNA nuclease